MYLPKADNLAEYQSSPMTPKSQSRNASCVPFRGRGPRSGEGVCEGKNDYDTLILCLIALRSGGRRLAVRTAMEHPIGALPRTPFPASRDFPSRGNERYEGKIASHILHVPFRRFPLLVAGATTLPGGKHVTGFAGRLQLPYESSSFATPASGGTMDV